MLRPNELASYLNDFVPRESARKLIHLIRDSPPSRSVSPSCGNITTAFCSVKMGRTINTESRTAEYRYAGEWEFCDNTYEFWDQVAPVPVVKFSRDGKTRNDIYRGDFLVLSKTGPFVAEVKTADKISELRAEAHPDWEFRDEAPHYLPGEAAFELIGLPFVVLSTASLHPRRTANIDLLLRAAEASTAVTPELLDRVDRHFSKTSCCTVTDLAESLQLVDHTALLQLVASRQLHVRLNDDLLVHPNTAWISRDPRFLSLVVPRAGLVSPSTGAGVILPSPAALARTIARQETLSRDRSSRTSRRLRALIREGAAEGKSEFESLVPNYSARGNREPRMNGIQRDFLREAVTRFYAVDANPNVTAAYRQYVLAAEKEIPEYRPLSITAFRDFIAQTPPEKIGMGRGGKRMANAMAGPSPVETRDLPPTRAFERAAIDHSLLPMYIVLYQRGNLRIPVKAWITALRDVATSFVLAIWMSLNCPSAKTDAILYRRCVRAHGRLPECIYSDNGSDFTSNFNTSFLGYMGVHHSRIPVAAPRFDESIENLFYQMQTGWLPHKRGNVTLGASERGTSSSHKPPKIADMTLKDTWVQIEKFVNWNNDGAADLSAISPAEQVTRSLERYSCSGVKASLTNEFLVSSAVETNGYKLDPQGGIRVNDRRYYCPALLQHRPARSEVQVRVDPENPHVVYAQIRGGWHACTSSGARMYETLDDIEKLVEATRLLEGNKYRKQVREAGQRDLVRIINEADAQRLRPQEPPVPGGEEAPIVKPSTIFDDVRSLKVEPPTEDDNEVFQDVLGLRRT
jgi:putative transposase